MARKGNGAGKGKVAVRDLKNLTFWGYKRENGRVGVRNHVIAHADPAVFALVAPEGEILEIARRDFAFAFEGHVTTSWS